MSGYGGLDSRRTHGNGDQDGGRKASRHQHGAYASFGGKGTFRLSAGTGKYKGLTGTGTFTFSSIGIATRTKSGACNLNANPVAYQQVINANGTAKLP